MNYSAVECSLKKLIDVDGWCLQRRVQIYETTKKTVENGAKMTRDELDLCDEQLLRIWGTSHVTCNQTANDLLLYGHSIISKCDKRRNLAQRALSGNGILLNEIKTDAPE